MPDTVSQQVAVKAEPQNTSPAKGNNSKLIIIGGLIVLVLIMVVGVAAFMLFGAKSTTTANNQITAGPKVEANALTIYHWWTSPGEVAAVTALVNVFSKKYPDVAIMSSPVTSAGNVDFQKILQPMVLNGQAPDSFQGHPGYEIIPYYNSKTIGTVDDLWKSENLESVIPKAIQDINKFKGNYYSVPIDVQRGNVVWYNKPLLDKNGINPATLTTWDAFFAACDKLRASGVQYPIQMGENWTETHVYENIAGSVGAQYFEDWANGKVTSETDPRTIQAFAIFKKYLSYTNTDYAKLAWNDAVDRVIKGQSAFNVMGDWANGEFKIVGMKYGKDYGTFPLPGTSNEYIVTVDTFVRPKGIAHSVNATNWLAVVGSKEGQDAFNVLKGSISARKDADVSLYDGYQKSAISDFNSAKYILPSRGTSMPPSFVTGLDGVIAAFVADKDVNKAAKAMADLTNKVHNDYIITWSFVK